MASSNINIDDGSDAKINSATNRNAFAALEGDEDEEEEGKLVGGKKRPKEIKPAMVSKQKGEREKDVVGREVAKYVPGGKKPVEEEDEKVVKEMEEEEEQEAEKKADKKPAAKGGKKVISGFQGHQRQQRDGDRRGGDRRDNRRENRGARGDNNNANTVLSNIFYSMFIIRLTEDQCRIQLGRGFPHTWLDCVQQPLSSTPLGPQQKCLWLVSRG
jgi:hypothetical protein